MIDSRALLESILTGLDEGVAQSLEEIKNEAQRRAPVRRLFKGGGRRRVRGGLAVHNYSFSAEPYQRSARVGRTLEGSYIRGRTNSVAPVTAPSRASGRTPIGGAQFRQVERQGNAFRFSNTRGVEGDFLGQALGDLRRGRGVRLISRELRGQTFLEREGIVAPSGHSRVKENLEYGGTLRDSIEVVGPFRNADSVTGYVKASAVEHGFNYAYAQEFGTAHNAPQPYLRPALRSMLRKVSKTQAYAVRTRLERTPHPVRLTSVNLRIDAVVPGTSRTAIGLFGRHLDRALR